MTAYLRPILHYGGVPSGSGRWLAGGRCWFERVALHRRDTPADQPCAELPVDACDPEALAPFVAPRAPIAGLAMDRARIMGVLNVTPDSFSDGGRFDAPEAALAHARMMQADGADILDIGGESTRPGARTIPPEEEVARTALIIAAIRAESDIAISIDTRKGPVGQAALAAGADLINDVAAFTYDPDLLGIAAKAGVPVCIMHAQGSPADMQDDPRYDDVLLDVYDFLADRVAVAVAAGIPRDRIVIDPGIGFGKTVAHNLALLRGLALFHGLGCPILLGASRKRFISALGGGETADDRLGGSLAVALHGARQGVQILRVHDTFATRQALDLAAAVAGAEGEAGAR